MELNLHIRTAGDPVLHTAAADVVSFDARLERLATEMCAAMQRAGGIGLAAPQIGVQRRVFVMHHNGSLLVAVNPVIEPSGHPVAALEGCLSLPDEPYEVRRPTRVTLHAQDVHGQRWSRRFEGWDARVVQHEVDHLDGILIADRSRQK